MRSPPPALRICAQPMELLARRDIKRLMQLCGDTEADVRAAIGLIGRLEPKPGRRFVDVERNIIIPDVIVTRLSGGGQPRFSVRLNADVMPRLRVHDIYASACAKHKGEGSQALQQRLQEARWFIKNIQQRFDTILRVSAMPSSSGRRASSRTASWPCGRWCCARSPTSSACTNPPSAA
jgi:RNA polymerase sigma-54 factor